MILYINLNVELDFLGLDYFFSHGVVISSMPFIFSGKQAQRIKDVDVFGYFLQFDTCPFENLRHCYNHSGYWMPYSMHMDMENILYLPYSVYMEMENILFSFFLENKLEIIFFI